MRVKNRFGPFFLPPFVSRFATKTLRWDGGDSERRWIPRVFERDLKLFFLKETFCWLSASHYSVGSFALARLQFIVQLRKCPSHGRGGEKVGRKGDFPRLNVRSYEYFTFKPFLQLQQFLLFSERQKLFNPL